MQYIPDDLIDAFGVVEKQYLFLDGKKYQILRAENHGLNVKEVSKDEKTKKV